MSSGFKTRSVQPQKPAACQVKHTPLISHLHDKRIKTTFYTDCKIYVDTFRESCFYNTYITQVSYRFLALGCFPANLVSDEKEQKNRRWRRSVRILKICLRTLVRVEIKLIYFFKYLLHQRI